MVYFKENIFPKVSVGAQHIPGGGNVFQGGGVQMLISIETHITGDFPGGWSGPPIPLWIRTQPSLGLCCSKNAKSGFLATRPIYCFEYGLVFVLLRCKSLYLICSCRHSWLTCSFSHMFWFLFLLLSYAGFDLDCMIEYN